MLSTPPITKDTNSLLSKWFNLHKTLWKNFEGTFPDYDFYVVLTQAYVDSCDSDLTYDEYLCITIDENEAKLKFIEISKELPSDEKKAMLFFDYFFQELEERENMELFIEEVKQGIEEFFAKHNMKYKFSEKLELEKTE